MIISVAQAPTTATTRTPTDEAATTVKGLEIYPNPVHNELYMVSAEDLTGSIVSVYDMTGRQVLNTKPVSNRIDVSRLASGTYTLIFIKEGKSITKRFVK